MSGRTVYLVTGATGFLGGHVARQLCDDGETVRALVRPGNPAVERLDARVERAYGDLLDGASLDAFFDVPSGTDVVVMHCAGNVALASGEDAAVRAVNVEGTRNILSRCVARRARKLVYVSSTSVIPERPMGEAIAEVDHFDPDVVVGYYAKTKAEATQLVLDTARETGLDASVVFPSGIFGPEDNARGLLTFFLTAVYKRLLPCGVAGSFNAVDVRDLAGGVIACAKRGRPGEGYIMANELADMRMIFRAVSRYAGTREVRLILPVWVARAAATVVEGVCGMLGRETVLTRFMVYNLARNNAYDSGKAKRELGFETRPFEKTIDDTLDWLAALGEIAKGDAHWAAPR